MKDHETLQTHNIKDGLTVHLVIKTTSRTSNDQTSSGPQPRAPGRCLGFQKCVCPLVTGDLVFVGLVIYIYIGFGGLVVSMLASGTQDRGFDPG